MVFYIILAYLCLLLFLGIFSTRLLRRTAGDFFLASRGIGSFMLLMSVFGTTMTAFALVGSTGKTFEKGIGVYGLMASWSGIVHAAVFFLVGVKVWALGKKYGYVTQVGYFRDRFRSDGVALTLFPVVTLFVMLYILMGVIAGGKYISNVTHETFAHADFRAEAPLDIDATPVIPGALQDRLRHLPEEGTLVLEGSVHPKWQGITERANPDLLGTSAGGESPFEAALASVFAEAPSGNVPYPAGMAIICLVVLAYVFFGGMRATAWANTLQTLVFMVMGIVAFVVITTQLGGPGAATQELLEDAHGAKRIAREGLIGKWEFLTYCFIPLSVGMFPHLFQHWLTARKASNFKLTVVAHPLCILITWVPCVLLGMWASGILPESTNPNAVLPMMVDRFSGPVLGGLIGAGVLAAIMSSMDSQFLCLSSLFTNDIVHHLVERDRLDDRQRVFLGRVFVVAVVAVSYAIGYWNPGPVFDLGVWCFTGFASLFPVVFASLYWKRVNKQGALASIITVAVLWCGSLPWVLGQESGEEFLLTDLHIMPVTVLIAASTLVLVVVTLLTPPPEPDLVRKFFPEKER